MNTADWDPVLMPGEQLFWQGRPAGGIRIQDQEIRLVILGIGIALIGFSFLNYPQFHVLAAGLSPIGMAIALLPVWRSLLRSRQWYAISSERAMISTGLPPKGRVRSWGITTSMPLELQGQAPEFSVYFAASHVRFGGAAWKIGFERIKDGRQALAILETLSAERKLSEAGG
ncbi:MAG: hypothetical protein AAFX00_02645 [Pseudomonadota bacterium]